MNLATSKIKAISFLELYAAKGLKWPEPVWDKLLREKLMVMSILVLLWHEIKQFLKRFKEDCLKRQFLIYFWLLRGEKAIDLALFFKAKSWNSSNVKPSYNLD